MSAVLDITSDFCGISLGATETDANILGLKAANAASSFALCYKTLQGVVPSDLTQSKINAIQEKNGNVFVAWGYNYHTRILNPVPLTEICIVRYNIFILKRRKLHIKSFSD